MAINKNKVYIILTLIIILLAAWLLISKFVLKPRPIEETSLPEKVEIDISVLNSQKIKELQLLEEIPSVETEIGRENPFQTPEEKKSKLKS